MYVDESGDPGLSQYSSKHFILTGLIIDANDWHNYLERLKIFRKSLKDTYSFSIRTEFHASEIFRPKSNNHSYTSIFKSTRIEMLKYYVNQIPIIFSNAKVLNICIKKADFNNTTEIQELAWNRLINRYDTFLKKSVNDLGVIISDESNEAKLRNLLRKSRIYNPMPSYFGVPYNSPIERVIEDIVHRKSHHSYFIQTCDVIAYLLYRQEFPKTSLKKYNVDKYFSSIEPILLKEASRSDKFGIVRK